MKKLLLILSLSAFMFACNNPAKTGTEEATDQQNVQQTECAAKKQCAVPEGFTKLNDTVVDGKKGCVLQNVETGEISVKFACEKACCKKDGEKACCKKDGEKACCKKDGEKTCPKAAATK